MSVFDRRCPPLSLGELFELHDLQQKRMREALSLPAGWLQPLSPLSSQGTVSALVEQQNRLLWQMGIDLGLRPLGSEPRREPLIAALTSGNT